MKVSDERATEDSENLMNLEQEQRKSKASKAEPLAKRNLKAGK